MQQPIVSAQSVEPDLTAVRSYCGFHSMRFFATPDIDNYTLSRHANVRGKLSQVIWLSRRTSRVPEPAVEVKDLQLVTALLQDDIMARDVRLSRR